MNTTFSDLCKSYTIKQIGSGYGPCPFCGALTRHTKRRDRRGALWVQGQSWKCIQCQRSGFGHHTEQAQPPTTTMTASPDIERAWKITECDDGELVSMCRLRGIDYDLVCMRGLAKCVPRELQNWYARGYTVMCALYDHHGYIQSLTARHREIFPKHQPKSLFYEGNSTRGLALMSDSFAYGLRKGHHFLGVDTVIFVEGIADFLALASIAEPPNAVVGITSATFTREFVLAFQEYHLVSALHEDAAGADYNRKLQKYSAKKVIKISITECIA